MGSFAADFFGRGAYGGKRRGEVGRHPLIIETDNCYLLWDAFPGLLQSRENPDSSFIVTSKNRVERYPCVDQAQDRGMGNMAIELARHDPRRVEGDA